jgi:hypothetical protein
MGAEGGTTGIRVPVHSLAVRARRGRARSGVASGGYVIRFKEGAEAGESGSLEGAYGLHYKYLYVGESRMSGCWMISAEESGEDVGRSLAARRTLTPPSY